MTEKKRYTHIDLLEVIAISFVLIYHSTLYEYDFLENANALRYASYLFRTILSTCVPMFFLTNGYLLFSKEYNLKKHWKRMAQLSVIPFFWGMVFMLIYMPLKGQDISTKQIVLALFNLKTEWHINFFWYIGALICIYILFPALKQLFDNDNKSFVLVTVTLFMTTFGVTLLNQLLLFVGAIIHHPLGTINYPIILMFVPLRHYGYSFVYFCLGGILYRNEDKLLAYGKSKRNACAAAGIIFSCLFLFLIGVFLSRSNGEIWDVVWNGYDTIPTFINVLCIYVLSLNYRKRINLIEEVSRNTLGIYLFHGMIITMTREYIKSYEFLCNIPINLIYAAAILAVSMIIVKIMKKIPFVRLLT